MNPENVPKGDWLKKFCRDLTAVAKEGKLDPVIGREEEIRRTIQVLSRRTKNNPVLIGAFSFMIVTKVILYGCSLFIYVLPQESQELERRQ